MSINLKGLGLALLAAFAMSAAFASAASAQTVEGEFESASGTVTATSETHVFTAGGLSVTCPHVEFEGTFTTPTKTLAITPKFPTNCTAFGIANTHIINSGCAFDFVLNNTHSEGLKKTSAAASLQCGSGSITLTPTIPIFGGSACTAHFLTQNVKGNVDIKVNDVAIDDLTIGPNTLGNASGPDGIAYNITSGGTGLCPAAGNYTNGAYHASATTGRAYSNEAHTIQVGGKLATN